MKPGELSTFYKDDPRVHQMVEALGSHKASSILLTQAAGSQVAIIASLTAARVKGIHLFIMQGKEEAAYRYNDLRMLNETGAVFLFPSPYRHAATREQIDKESVLKRTETLERLNALPGNQEAMGCIVTYPEALAEGVVARKMFRESAINLRRGQPINLERLNEQLFNAGFERCAFVSEPGEFSVRGGIVDVFSYSNDDPYRLEMVGDTLESIRTFDTNSQVSIEQVNAVTIIPDLNREEMEGPADKGDSLFTYLPDNTTLWVDHYPLYMEMAGAASAYGAVLNRYTRIFTGGKAEGDMAAVIDFNSTPQPVFNKHFELLIENLESNNRKDYSTLILSENVRQIQRLNEIFDDIREERGGHEGENLFTPILLSLHEGFTDHDRRLACYTDHQIFNRYHRLPLTARFSKKTAMALRDFHNLEKGDYVVHIDHGIGQFAALEKIDVNGKPQEAIRLVYKGGDILYVSIHSLHRISKYSGREGFEPRVDKLGSAAWKNLKQKTKNKVKDIAKDLIKLYAGRKSRNGFAYSPDSYLQTELEASFIYTDTPDQFKASEDTKKDMEAQAPMDRLICGDVGFGKTEVAIRAAFKAATDGKQVAVLAPTTILTSQHFRTFSQRLKEFPVQIDYLNRFKSAKKQKETLKNLAEGRTDIIIGTHRLVSKDVKFKDLGLLIIDEEQKFGVASKEKLKNLRVDVDTMTLTATPIPRTLQFSLMNARDLSIINTAPPDRYPIQTELCVFNEATIRDAIEQEVFRGGQVFFVHNRVQHIEDVAHLIRRLCPGVKVGTGHGQMHGHELEKVMLKFIDGDYDVLVATTIIESGLDIPNANTIIINNAHFFGLSDLHQMRGRVGRSNKKAFCYLITPPLSSLTSDARKRLQTLEEFSELGSGFNIAMRDLDIRGAGNLLGAEQSGFINELGFETYHKILDEAVLELKQNEFKDTFVEEGSEHDSAGGLDFVADCLVETDMELLIPDNYVNSITERLRLYKELNEMADDASLDEYGTRLQDRFGPLPQVVAELIRTVKLRRICAGAGIEKLVLKQGKGIGYFITNRESAYYQSDNFTKVLAYIQSDPGEILLKEDRGKLVLVLDGIDSIGTAIERISRLQQAPKPAFPMP